jgi:hypothetical protein
MTLHERYCDQIDRLISDLENKSHSLNENNKIINNKIITNLMEIKIKIKKMFEQKEKKKK